MYENNHLSISESEIADTSERENKLISIGVVLSTMAIIAAISLILISSFEGRLLSSNTTSSVGKTEPA